MKKLLSVILIALSFAAPLGCRKQVTTDPQVVTTPQTPAERFQRVLLTAADATDVFSSALLTLDNARKDIHAAGDLSDADSLRYLANLKILASKNELARQAIDLAKTSGDTTVDWRSKLNDVTSAIGTIDPASYGIKNPQSQQALQSAFKIVQAAVAGLTASVQAN